MKRHFAAAAAAALVTGAAGCGNAGSAPGVSETPPPSPKQAKILFAGDAMCHMGQIASAARQDGTYDFSASFEHIKPLFDSADIVAINFETVVSSDGIYSGYPRFSSPGTLADALREAGADIFAMANNHCCDGGAPGIAATLTRIDSLGALRTGVFRDSTDMAARHPLRFTHDSISFAMLNYTYGTNGLPVPKGYAVNLIDTAAIRRDLRSAQDADCRIVFIHWGEEYKTAPDRTQKRLAEFIAGCGADIIIGSHPHAVQPADTTGGRIIVYSLGNFVSNQRWRYSDGGIIASVDIRKDPDGRMHFSMSHIPVWVKLPGYRILPPQAADAAGMSAAERTQYDQFISDTEEIMGTL